MLTKLLAQLILFLKNLISSKVVTVEWKWLDLVQHTCSHTDIYTTSHVDYSSEHTHLLAETIHICYVPPLSAFRAIVVVSI